jgi:hypothetical protein
MYLITGFFPTLKSLWKLWKSHFKGYRKCVDFIVGVQVYSKIGPLVKSWQNGWSYSGCCILTFTCINECVKVWRSKVNIMSASVGNPFISWQIKLTIGTQSRPKTYTPANFSSFHISNRHTVISTMLFYLGHDIQTVCTSNRRVRRGSYTQTKWCNPSCKHCYDLRIRSLMVTKINNHTNTLAVAVPQPPPCEKYPIM